MPLDGLFEREFVEFLRGRVLHRVGRVDAVHFRRLHERLAVRLQRAQRRGRVGGEERASGPACVDHDLAARELFQRGVAFESRRERPQVGGRVDVHRDPGLLECVFQAQGVHDRREHAHVVGRHAVHSGRSGSAPDVARAHHERDLHAESSRFRDPGDGRVDRSGVVTVFLFAFQCFTADFE